MRMINTISLTVAMLLLPSAAIADSWSVGDCTTQTGTKILYALQDGQGLISYDGGPTDRIFSKRDGENIGLIIHIGKNSNMTLAIEFSTGRGYAVTKFDNGTTVEANVSCKMSVIEK